MNRNEIIARLMENDSTVLSFPDRGPCLSSGYVTVCRDERCVCHVF